MKIKVKVIPNAKKEKVVQDLEYIKVYVNQPPLEGRANKRLVELLAEYFKIDKKSIKIIQGERSRVKLIKIDKNEDN